jgi:hypothetical protein
MDFLLVTTTDGDNPDVGDLKLTDGQVTLTPDLKTAVAQHIAIRLRTFFGEWFLDADEGVPYFELILVKNPDLGRINSIFRSVILETPGVSSIARLQLTVTTARQLNVTDLRIKLDDGATLTGADFGRLIAYRTGDETTTP